MVSDLQSKKIIAQNLNRILRERGKSRHWLAVEMGEYDATIARICNGKNLAGAGLITRIAEALDVSTDEILLPHRPKFPKAG